MTTHRVPAELLTVQTLADCAQALIARRHNRMPMTPDGAVLYDWCIENKITKLAPPSILNRVRDPDHNWHDPEIPLQAHRWMVVLFTNNTESPLSVHFVGIAPASSMEYMRAWVREPTARNRRVCERHGHNGALQMLVYRPETFGQWGNRSETLAYRLCCSLNDYLPEPAI